MPGVHKAVQNVSRFIPNEWKRKVKTTLFDAPDTENSLLRMQRLGFDPATAIDVGAYVGEWTRTFKRIFPRARVLMVEPQPKYLDRLRNIVSTLIEVEVAPVLLGARQNPSVPFRLCESASSVLIESANNEPVTTVSLPMNTLDEVTCNSVFAKCDFIKLDAQGYELEVLKGGERTLSSAAAVLLEVNLIGILDGAPLFHETAQFMSERGFQVYDICTFFRRPYDGALWQVDVIFVRSTSPLVACKRWA
jgi:FkbM family methyltransferase